jgi:hypothetical protein
VREVLKREELKPGMRVENLSDPSLQGKIGVIRSDRRDPQKILLPVGGDLSLVPVIIIRPWGEIYTQWPLSSLKVVE